MRSSCISKDIFQDLSNEVEQSNIRSYSLLIAATCFIGLLSAFAQYPDRDTVRHSEFKTESSANTAVAQLPRFKKDTNRITRLNELAKYFITLSHTYNNNAGRKRAIQYLKEGLRLSDSLHNEQSPNRYESQMLLAQLNQTAEGENLYQAVINAYQMSGNKKAQAQFWYRYGCALAYQPVTSEDQYHKIISAFDHCVLLYHEVGNKSMEIDVGIERVKTIFNFGMPNLETELKILADKSIAYGRIYLPSIYLLHAGANRYKGNLNDALAYSLPALRILREKGDTTLIADYYGEIALEYGELGRSTESVAYYKKCLDGREKSNVNQYVIYRTATLMASEMIKNNRAAQAFEILKSLERRNPPRGDLERAIIEHGMANCLAVSGKYDLAEKYYISMIKGYQQNESNEEILLIAYCDVVKFLIARKQFKQAEAYYDQLYRLSSSPTIARKSEVELLLFKIDSMRSRFPEAIRHYQLFKKYNDSIFNKIKSEQIEELHVRYSSKQKDQNIKLLTKQTELQQAKLRQSDILRNSLFAGTIMLILLLSLVYSRYRLKTRSNLLLEKQQEEISRKNSAQQLLLNEKDWLIREIHHRVKNNFHMVVGLMGTQSTYVKSTEGLQALENSKHRIHTMSLIHQKLYQSENLSATMMTDYIHELVSYLKNSFETKHILFVIDCERIELDVSHSLPLGLILNESITNSIKYAFPDTKEGTIQIILQHTSADNIRLIISDNGVGIPIGEDGTIKSTMGLNLIAGLTEDISGTLTINNKNGTTIQIDFPYVVVKTDHQFETK